MDEYLITLLDIFTDACREASDYIYNNRAHNKIRWYKWSSDCKHCGCAGVLYYQVRLDNELVLTMVGTRDLFYVAHSGGSWLSAGVTATCWHIERYKTPLRCSALTVDIKAILGAPNSANVESVAHSVTPAPQNAMQPMLSQTWSDIVKSNKK